MRFMRQKLQPAMSSNIKGSWTVGTVIETTQFGYLITIPDPVAMPLLVSKWAQKYLATYFPQILSKNP